MDIPEQAARSLHKQGIELVVGATRGLSDDAEPAELRLSIVQLAIGSELVLKGVLAGEDWQQVFSRPERANLEHLRTGNLHSATMEQCIERLDDALPSFASAPLNDLRVIRNRLVHFGIQPSEDAIRSVSAKVLTALLDVIATESEKDLVNDEQVGELRAELLKCEDFVNQRLAALPPDIHTIPEFECPECMVDALEPGPDPHCYFCRAAFRIDDVLEKHMDRLGIGGYEHVVNGGSLACYDCPECGEKAWVPLDQTRDAWVCVHCALSAKRGDFEFCDDCGRTLLLMAEDDMPLCSDCFDARP